MPTQVGHTTTTGTHFRSTTSRDSLPRGLCMTKNIPTASPRLKSHPCMPLNLSPDFWSGILHVCISNVIKRRFAHAKISKGLIRTPGYDGSIRVKRTRALARLESAGFLTKISADRSLHTSSNYSVCRAGDLSAAVLPLETANKNTDDCVGSEPSVSRAHQL